MNNLPNVKFMPRLVLCAETAADLMGVNPLSILASATVTEAAAFLADKGFQHRPGNRRSRAACRCAEHVGYRIP